MRADDITINLDSGEGFKYAIDSDLVYSEKLPTKDLSEQFPFNESVLGESHLESIALNILDETDLPQETDPAEKFPRKKEIPEGKPIEETPGEQIPLD